MAQRAIRNFLQEAPVALVKFPDALREKLIDKTIARLCCAQKLQRGFANCSKLFRGVFPGGFFSHRVSGGEELKRSPGSSGLPRRYAAASIADFPSR